MSNLEATLRQAGLYNAMGRADHAETLLERALQDHPDDPDLWAAMGVVRDALGRPDLAIEALRRAIRLRPDHHHAWTNLAFIAGREDLDEGIRVYGELLERWPDDFPALHNLACLLRDAGRHAEALHRFLDALILDEAVPALHLNLALLYRRTGRDADARTHLRRALALAPDFALARDTLAEMDGRD